MNSILMPATTGSRALGTSTLSTPSWLTCTAAAPGSYQESVVTPVHLQIANAVPADRQVVAGFGADAARKRGRPPRGEPR